MCTVYSPFYEFSPSIYRHVLFDLYSDAHTHIHIPDSQPPALLGWLSQITLAPTRHPGMKSIQAPNKQLDPSLNGHIWGLLDTDVSAGPRPTTGVRHKLVSHKVM